MPAKAIPEGYHSITPYLVVDDASGAIEFYKRAFGAKENLRMPTPDGKVAHAELAIGDSLIMLSDPFDQGSTKTPRRSGRRRSGSSSTPRTSTRRTSRRSTPVRRRPRSPRTCSGATGSHA